MQAIEVPLRVDTDGVIRVGQTRVTLDLVIGAFQRGESPEAIIRQFPAISLAEAYAVITYYLQHREEINAYLQKGAEEEDRIRRELEDQFNPVGLRGKLMARLKEKK